ncbi:hypothetical protein NECAME_06973 [Necator americanus]|uniref:Chromo domain-containing protein n=1 Tax=Necator americanus TaxID=51031 RepID=W2TRD5_NECAM|nr:hypothetical protein NECAME_06973 [Necator americanus]ETN84229.1 hypothetical protein NECAME_06973 [Necator americanus]
MQYGVGDLVRCIWGAKPVEYEAKILDVDNESEEYYVHYQGWNKRYDEWITESSIIGWAKKHEETIPQIETPKIRHSKREKKAKKPIDWSPAHNVPVRHEEQPLRRKHFTFSHARVTNNLKLFWVPHAYSSKPKRSPPNKVSKHPAPLSSIIANESTDDEPTSDEEIIDLSIPRSYIDVLAKAKRRAERKRNRGALPQFTQATGSGSNSSHTRSLPNGAHPMMRPTSTNKHTTASGLSSTVSTSMECHNFASIDKLMRVVTTTIRAFDSNTTRRDPSPRFKFISSSAANSKVNTRRLPTADCPPNLGTYFVIYGVRFVVHKLIANRD